MHVCSGVPERPEVIVRGRAENTVMCSKKS